MSISSVTSEVLEAGVGSLSLSCEAESNPAAGQVMWLDVDTGDVLTYSPKLEFSPVLRRHARQYGCVASNEVGNSSMVTYTLDVLCK